MVMRIKELRERLEMSQAQLGAEVGATQTAVSQWESEVYLPKTRQLPQLASVLGCTIDALFVKTETERPSA